MVILTLKLRPHSEQGNVGGTTQLGSLGQGRTKGLTGQTELLLQPSAHASSCASPLDSEGEFLLGLFQKQPLDPKWLGTGGRTIVKGSVTDLKRTYTFKNKLKNSTFLYQ